MTKLKQMGVLEVSRLCPLLSGVDNQIQFNDAHNFHHALTYYLHDIEKVEEIDLA